MTASAQRSCDWSSSTANFTITQQQNHFSKIKSFSDLKVKVLPQNHQPVPKETTTVSSGKTALPKKQYFRNSNYAFENRRASQNVNLKKSSAALSSET